MSILDKKSSKKEDAKKSEKKSMKSKQFGFEYRTIIKPHITEKATLLAENATYVFQIKKSATKRQVKTAVESIYDVKVRSIRTISHQGKKKRRGRQVGRTSAWKKAYVTLNKGEEIDILS